MGKVHDEVNRRRAKMDKVVSPAVLAVAAAGYQLGEELNDPVIDISCRAMYRARLERAIAALTTEERIMLAREGDLNG